MQEDIKILGRCIAQLRLFVFGLSLLVLLSLAACTQSERLSDYYYDQGSNIDYRGIRTEDRKNKARSELDK